MVSLKKTGHPAMYTMLIALLLTGIAPPAQAIDTAPRISDREIIESLAELKAGQKALWKSQEQGHEAINKRIDGLDQAINKRIDGLDQGINKRIDELRAELNFRFSTLFQLIIAILTMIGGLIGLVIWDRRTTVRPVKEQLERVEQTLDGVKQELDGVKQGLEHDLEPQHPGGSLPARLVQVLREYARGNGELATILRTFSLL